MTTTNEIRNRIKKIIAGEKTSIDTLRKEVLEIIPKDHVLVKEKDLLTENEYHHINGHGFLMPDNCVMCQNIFGKLKAFTTNVTKLEQNRNNYEFPKKTLTSNNDTMIGKCYVCRGCKMKWKSKSMLNEKGLCVHCSQTFYDEHGWKNEPKEKSI